MKKTLRIASICLSILFISNTIICYAGGPQAGQINLGTEYTEQYNLTESEGIQAEAKRAEVRRKRLSSGGIELDGYEQIVGYYCGPAAALTAIKHLGGSVASQTATLCFFNANESDQNCLYPNVVHTHVKQYTSPQITLANALGTTYSGTSIGNMLTVINSRQIKYTYDGDHIDDTQNNTNITHLGENLLSSFIYDAAPILWVEAGLLQEYINKNATSFGGHYICAASYNSATQQVGIFDPNYYSSISDYYFESASAVVRAIWVNSSSNVNILF